VEARGRVVKQLSTGFVALLDILGFSAMVRAEGFIHTIRKYTRILDDVTGSNERLLYITFSDTIVIYIDDSETPLSGSELREVLSAVGEICYRFLVEVDCPLRGCVTVGKLMSVLHTGGTILAGSAIVEAYSYEKKQDWVGVIVSPRLASKEKYFDKQLLVDKGFVDEYETIPFKMGEDAGTEDFKGYVVIPRTKEDVDVLSIDWFKTAKFPDALKRLRMFAPGPSEQRKYQQALDWWVDFRGRRFPGLRKTWGS